MLTVIRIKIRKVTEPDLEGSDSATVSVVIILIVSRSPRRPTMSDDVYKYNALAGC